MPIYYQKKFWGEGSCCVNWSVGSPGSGRWSFCSHIKSETSSSLNITFFKIIKYFFHLKLLRGDIKSPYSNSIITIITITFWDARDLGADRGCWSPIISLLVTYHFPVGHLSFPFLVGCHFLILFCYFFYELGQFLSTFFHFYQKHI